MPRSEEKHLLAWATPEAARGEAGTQLGRRGPAQVLPPAKVLGPRGRGRDPAAGPGGGWGVTGTPPVCACLHMEDNCHLHPCPWPSSRCFGASSCKGPVVSPRRPPSAVSPAGLARVPTSHPSRLSAGPARERPIFNLPLYGWGVDPDTGRRACRVSRLNPSVNFFLQPFRGHPRTRACVPALTRGCHHHRRRLPPGLGSPRWPPPLATLLLPASSGGPPAGSPMKQPIWGH